MDKRLNEYQYVVNGVTVQLSELTHEQALVAVADMLDVIEQIDEDLYKDYIEGPAKIISDWRYSVK